MSVRSPRRKRDAIMLASPYNEKQFSNCFYNTSKVYIQPKLNGERAVYDGETLLSSTGLEITGVPHILEALSGLVLPPGMKLDGELYAPGMRFQDIHGIISRHGFNLHPGMTAIQYHIFDALTPYPQDTRLAVLWKNSISNPFLVYVQTEKIPTSMVTSQETRLQLLEIYLSAGFEGFVVRHPLGMYEMRRSPFLVKIKQLGLATGWVCAIEEAHTKTGERKGMVGALHVKEKLTGVEFKVSPGVLSHEERIWIWEHSTKVVGTLIKVHYSELSKAGIPLQPRIGDNTFLKEIMR